MNVRRMSLIIVSLLIAGLVMSPGMAQVRAQEPTAEAPVAEGTPYTIGFCAAITGGGSSLGVPEKNTAEMIAEKYADGIIGPDGVHHDLSFIVYDTESNPDTAASVASRLITEDEVDVLVCGTTSGASMAAVPIATENEIPMISMASARSIVEDPDTGEARYWIFKTAQDNSASGEWQAVYMDTVGITSACDLYENTSYGQDCLAQTTKAAEDKGIEIAYSDAFERTDTEFPQMSSVQASGCEALVIGAVPPGASMVTIAARETLPNTPVILGHGVCNQTFIDVAGDAAEGAVLPCGRLLVADGLPDTDPQKEVLLQYIADYTQFTDGEPVSTFGGHGWDAVMMSIESLSSLEEGLTLAERHAAVRDYLETSIVDWPGISGIFNITPEDHFGLSYDSLEFVEIVDGQWTDFPPEDWATAGE